MHIWPEILNFSCINQIKQQFLQTRKLEMENEKQKKKPFLTATGEERRGLMRARIAGGDSEEGLLLFEMRTEAGDWLDSE